MECNFTLTVPNNFKSTYGRKMPNTVPICQWFKEIGSMLQQKLLARLQTSHKDVEHKLYELISHPYPCTDETILNKNLTNALI